MADIVKIPGIPVPLGGKDYVMPPLALNAVKQLRPRLDAFKGTDGDEDIDTVIDAAYAALRRNYPDISRDEVGDMVDLGNMQEVMEACMDVSGLKRKQLEAGELKPGKS
jgi:hypothetical protein